jgi:hypothetical protein
MWQSHNLLVHLIKSENMNNKIKSQGKIQNMERLRQIPVFEKLRYDITDGSGYGIQSPTDGDMIFEFQGKLNIIVDFKLTSKPLEDGQSRTFTTMVDALQEGGYEGAYLIIASHNTPIDVPVYDASTCVVNAVYSKGKWYSMSDVLTIEDVFNKLISKHNLPLKKYVEPHPNKEQLLKMLDSL